MERSDDISPYHIRSDFSNEWVWRLFVVSQVVGLILVAYLDVSSYSWGVLPSYSDYTGWSWGLFNGDYWRVTSSNPYNWYASALLIGPYLCSRAVDWIVDGKK